MNGYGSYRTIRWRVEANIGFLVLDQPPGNIMTLAFFNEFSDWLDHAEKNPTALIIIQGATRHFSSGTDLEELLGEIEGATRAEGLTGSYQTPGFLYRNSSLFKRLNNLKIPVIAAISGVCIGSAFELALHCHFRISSKESLFGLPETTFGLIPGLGGTSKIQQILKQAKAIEYLLMGKTFTVPEALNLGIIDMVAERKNLSEVALSFGRMLPENFRDFDRTLLVGKISRDIHRMSRSQEKMKTITRYDQQAK